MGPRLPLDANLPVDPEVEQVRLDNGLTMLLRPARQPSPRVALWLVVRCGSLGEREGEQGLAHFVEHLAFRGSRRFAPGGIERRLAALGLASGRQLNAFTSTVDTAYCLLLPGDDRDALGVGLDCLADIASGLALEEQEVERERRVILEEVRADRGAGERVRERVLRLLLPDATLAERHPLGAESSIAGATVDRLRDFYDRWYRPGASTLLVAGDFDPDSVRGDVVERFGGWPEGDPASPPGVGAAMGVEGQARAGLVLDPEVVETEVQVVSVWPSTAPRMVGDLRSVLLEDLGLYTLNRRLSELAAGEHAPFGSASASVATLLGCLTQARAMACCGGRTVGASTAALLAELQRMRSHGPLPDELEEARTAALARAHEAVRGAPHRDPEAVARELHLAVRAGRLPVSADQRRDLLEQLLPGVDSGEVAPAFARRFDPQRQLLLVVGPDNGRAEMPAAEDLLRLHLAVLDHDPGPPPPRGREVRLLDRRPPAAAVTDRLESDGGTVVSVTLDNGVLVHLRPTDRHPGRVLVHVGLVGGRLLEGVDDVGLTAAGAAAFAVPACRRHSSAVFRRVLAGRTLDLSGWVDEDLVSVRLSVGHEDVEVALEALHLLLAEPRLEPFALDRWRQVVERQAADRASSVESSLAAAAVSLLTGGDHRFQPLSAARARSISLERAQGWVDALVGTGPLEAALVGDLGADRMVELARWSLGSLPRRRRSLPGLEPLRALPVRPGPTEVSLVVPTVTPRAAVRVGYRAAAWGAKGDRRLLHVAERVLGQRLHRNLRQDEGLTYSAQCSFNPSRAFPAASMLAVACAVPPERAEEAVDWVLRLVDEELREGPAAEELEAARRQLVELVDTARRAPQYWAGHLAELSLRGASVHDLDEAGELYRTCTAEQVRDALARWAVPANRLVVVCRPG
jgi:zinc protease